MTNDQDVSPFVFREHNDESTYIDYEEIANRDQADSKSKINNDHVLPLPEIAKESKGIKVGSKVLINTKDSSIEWKKDWHGHIRTVINCKEFCHGKKKYEVSEDPCVWFNEFDLILIEDSTSSPLFDINKYNKNYTEMATEVLKDCKGRLTDTDKPINEARTTLSIKLVSQIAYSDKEIAECFANLKVGDEIKIKDKKYCGLWGKYNNDFCDKWYTVIETCPDHHYIAVENAVGNIALVDLFVVQIMAIKDCAISEIKNPTWDGFNNLKPGDKVLLKSIEECHAEDWRDEFKACCGRWVTIRGGKIDYRYEVEEGRLTNGNFLHIGFENIAAIRKV